MLPTKTEHTSADTENPRQFPSLWGCTWIFVLISAFGWCFEKIGRYLVYHSTADRGFLTLPVCPIYGTCILLIGFLLGSPSRPSPVLDRAFTPLKRLPRPLSFVIRLILYFFGATALSTLIEGAVGLIFQAAGIPLWNYTERVGNIAGVICPSFSLLWGTLITLVMSLIWDPLCRLVNRIPLRPLRIVAVFCIITLLCDFLFNCLFVLITGTRFLFL